MLTNKHQWIAGPAFLVQQDIDIKIDVGIFGISQDLNFQSNVTINNYSKETSTLKQKPEKQPHCSISANWEYYSSFSKIVGHIAWIVKLKRNCVASKYNLNKPNFYYLSVDKLQDSKSIILKLCQNESYHQEIEILQKRGTIHRGLQIIALDPIFKDNLPRVGGQI